MKRNEIMKNIIIGLIVVGIGAGFYWYHHTQQPNLEAISGQEPASTKEKPVELKPDYLTCYIAGAVQAPGLYQVPEGGRVADAIILAGGFTVAADSGSVNLAAPCKDGAKIVVKSIRTKAAKPIESGLKIHLNSASFDNLLLVPGIGPKLAKAIIEYREEQGLFRHITDILEVKGIHPKTAAAILPYLDL